MYLCFSCNKLRTALVENNSAVNRFEFYQVYNSLFDFV